MTYKPNRDRSEQHRQHYSGGCYGNTLLTCLTFETFRDTLQLSPKASPSAFSKCCLIDFVIALSFVVCVLAGTLWLSSGSVTAFGALVSLPHDRGQAFVVGRLLMSPTRLEPQQFKRDRPFWHVRLAVRVGCHAHTNSVLVCQRVWSRMASLRATATLARLKPLVSARFRPHVRSAQGRFTLLSKLLAAS